MLLQIVSHFDSYANPIFGATIVVSGGYGANVSGTTDGNGYYTIAIKPINIGGPFALNFAVTSAYGSYNTIQSNLTVTAPLVVPVAKVLAGTVIAGQTGTMPAHIGGANTLSLSWWTGGGSTVYLLPPAGYYDGGTWTYQTEPNLVPGNIANGVNVLGVTGTFQGAPPTHGSQSWTTPGTYYWTVPAGVSSIMVIATGGGGAGGYGNFGYSTVNPGGGGGGAGGTNINMITVTPGQVLTVIVGSGGTVTGFGLAGNTGGTSSIGSLSASGGLGGAQPASWGGLNPAGGGAGGGYGGYGATGESGYGYGPWYGGAGMGGYGNGGIGIYGAGQSTNGSPGRVVISW